LLFLDDLSLGYTDVLLAVSAAEFKSM